MKAKEAKAARQLYLIRDGESSYKIGSTKNPKGRLKELQVGSCRRLVLLWSVQTELALWIEDYLHCKFRSQQIIGEWFSLNAEEVQWIMSLSVEEIRRLWQEAGIARQKQEVHRLGEDGTGMDARGANISESELEVFKVLWEHAAGTVREINTILRGQGRRWAYTTVQTLLQRLESKGHVRSGPAHIYRDVAHEPAAPPSVLFPPADWDDIPLLPYLRPRPNFQNK